MQSVPSAGKLSASDMPNAGKHDKPRFVLSLTGWILKKKKKDNEEIFSRLLPTKAIVATGSPGTAHKRTPSLIWNRRAR